MLTREENRVANKQVTLAARKTGETWEAALVVDGKFMRAFMGSPGESLSALAGIVLLSWLSPVHNQGTEVAVNISISEPDAE